MNLLLHGLEYPEIDPGNALRFPLREIGDKDRVDIVMTNPPFGGEEEKGILSNFPEDKQTTETALLFLQLIMRKLRRNVAGHCGRAAVVVPDGILSQEGVAARVREQLVKNYNLHTIVRFPKGVFEPYTKSSTSVLFFDTKSPSDFVWFYEVPLRTGIKAYTQTQPFEFAETAACIAWWNERKENDSAWKVPLSEIEKQGYSLNFRNPKVSDSHRFDDPEMHGKALIERIQRLHDAVQIIVNRWNAVARGKTETKWLQFSDIATEVSRAVNVNSEIEYPIMGMSWYAKGLYVKYRKKGSEIKATKLYKVEEGDFVYNRLFAWKGSFAEAAKEHDGCYVSNEFPCFTLDTTKVQPGYLWAYFAQPSLWDYIESMSTGTTSTSRLRLNENKIKRFRIPIPPREVQREIARAWQEALEIEKNLEHLGTTFQNLVPAILERAVPFSPNATTEDNGSSESEADHD